MLRKSLTKAGFILSLLLIIITSVQISYLFYQKLTEPEFPQTPKKVRSDLPKVNHPPNPTGGKDYLISLIPQAKQKRQDNIDEITTLKSIEKEKICYLTANCFEVMNKSDGWQSGINNRLPLFIPGPFMLRVALQNQNDSSGIVLQNKPSRSSFDWWRNINMIFIGVKNHGKSLSIVARDGSSPQASIFQQKRLEQSINLLNIFFSQAGQTILITDEQYEPIEYVDVNQATEDRFPEGIFPENQIYLGFGAAPKSYLLILEFLIIPL